MVPTVLFIYVMWIQILTYSINNNKIRGAHRKHVSPPPLPCLLLSHSNNILPLPVHLVRRSYTSSIMDVVNQVKTKKTKPNQQLTLFAPLLVPEELDDGFDGDIFARCRSTSARAFLRVHDQACCARSRRRAHIRTNTSWIICEARHVRVRVQVPDT